MHRRDFCRTSAALFAATALTARSVSSSAQPLLNPPGVRTAGIQLIPVAGGKYKVWTKRVGPAGDDGLKVLLLHGGPGFTHEYLECFEDFLPQSGITFYLYDQLGSAYSDQPADPALWTLPRFVEEVEEVRQGLGLDNFVLYGHSWGGMLTIDYALKYQRHLRGVVISNMAAGIQACLKRSSALKALLKPENRIRLAELEAKQDYDNPDYQRIMMEDAYPQMVCRLQPWPDPVIRAFSHANQAIYNQMQGKSEFLVTGNLKDWERWDRLHEITVPALTIGAEHDEMDPEDMRRMAKLMPRGQNLYCPTGSHLAMWDDQQVYFDGLIKFLKSV
jgi:proline iminopeptidase